MQISVKDIGADGKQIDDSIPVGALGFPADLRFTGPLVVSVHLNKSGQQIDLKGRVRATLELECHRCMDEYTFGFEAPFEGYFVPRPADAPADEEPEVGLYYYSDTRIDLEPNLREAVILEIPMKQLCRPDCAGLCAKCGGDRNAGECDCPRDSQDDNPFAAFFRDKGMLG